MAITQIDQTVCIGCGVCFDACSLDVIAFSTDERKPSIAFQEDCMTCELCAALCSAGAIAVTPEYTKKARYSWG